MYANPGLGETLTQDVNTWGIFHKNHSVAQIKSGDKFSLHKFWKFGQKAINARREGVP